LFPDLPARNPGFPASMHWTEQRVRLSVKKDACSSTPPTSTGNPGNANPDPTKKMPATFPAELRFV
jgi:hypothetical protein